LTFLYSKTLNNFMDQKVEVVLTGKTCLKNEHILRNTEHCNLTS